ncbi:MAG TPA: ABC transporter permease, partial [Candidatus Limnocylindrales bacterium]|nr:ABC transporter permease [Candidatus Limnocylindrales bacterium]
MSTTREPVGRTSGTGGLSNAVLVAKREYIERVRSRAFLFSTLLLAGLAVVVALIPLGVRLVDRAAVSRIVVAAEDDALATQAIGTLETFLNAQGAATNDDTPPFLFERIADADTARRLVSDGAVAASMVIERGEDGGLDFTVYSIGGLSPDRAQLLQLGTFTVGLFDWTASTEVEQGNEFKFPGFEVSDPLVGDGSASSGGEPAIDAAEYASRRIVGIVFVVLTFLTLVFYGLWVASGVVAEKAGRVMELLISAATPQQLVTGKILGIGAAGLTQVSLVLVPALLALFGSGELANQLLGPDANAGTSLAGLSPGLLAAFLVYFVLGFGLYAALYAGAGSLLSRAEDLQIVALPLSIPAVMGYFPAVLALSGGTSAFIRIASYVPLWSPFVMLARLSIGRVEPWEVALSVGLLVITVPIV